MNNLQVLDERKVLHKDFTIYGTPEEPLFLAKDVAEWIDHSNPTEMLRSVDEDEKLVSTILSSGQNREVLMLTENGFYEVLMLSRKPIAKKFKKEVKKILKSIRKHGAYMTPKTIEKTLNDPDFIIGLAERLKDEQKKRIEAERFNKQIACSKNSLLVREVAKIASKNGINIGEKRLYSKLRDWGLVFKNRTEPYQRYIDNGYFEVHEGVVERPDSTFTYRTTKVTGKGQVYIIKRLIKEREEAYEQLQY
jgi:prophage antirepressor-like protein